MIIFILARYIQKTNKNHHFAFFTKESKLTSKRFFWKFAHDQNDVYTVVKGGLSVVLHLPWVRQTNFVSVSQNDTIFQESLTF